MKSDFTHLEAIANHFFEKVGDEWKAFPLKAEEAIVFLRGYELVGKVKFSFPHKPNFRRLPPYFEFWKFVRIDPYDDEDFEPDEGSRSWEMTWA